MTPLNAALTAGLHTGAGLIIEVFIFWRFNLRLPPARRWINYTVGTLTLMAGLADYGRLTGAPDAAGWQIVALAVAGACTLAAFGLAWGLDWLYTHSFYRALAAPPAEEARHD